MRRIVMYDHLDDTDRTLDKPQLLIYIDKGTWNNMKGE